MSSLTIMLQDILQHIRQREIFFSYYLGVIPVCKTRMIHEPRSSQLFIHSGYRKGRKPAFTSSECMNQIPLWEVEYAVLLLAVFQWLI